MLMCQWKHKRTHQLHQQPMDTVHHTQSDGRVLRYFLVMFRCSASSRYVTRSLLILLVVSKLVVSFDKFVISIEFV